MRLNKYKIYTISLGFISGLSILGNAVLLKKDTESNKKIIEITKEANDLEKELEELEKIDQLESIDDLNEYFSGYLSFYYDNYAWMFGHCSPQLTIQKPEYVYKEINISEKLYRRIRMILSRYQINSLELINLKDEIDLQKLEITPYDNDSWNNQVELEELIIKEIDKDFDYQQLGTMRIDHIEISVDECTESMKRWLEQINLENTEIIIDSNHFDSFLKFLIDTKKEIHTLQIISNSEENGLDLISEINAKRVIIDSRSYYQEKLDFDLSLNENTEYIEFFFTNYDGEIGEGNHLGKIKVVSENPNLSINITSNLGTLSHVNSITYVTDKTSFDFPDQSTIRFHNIKCLGNQEKLNGTITYDKSDDIEDIIKKVEKESYQKIIKYK